ncbi:MAG: hypothetical protein K9L28_05380 [Synergistales bacterium]|nr:hypothetical protein [Synergistales bacterium]
MSKVTATTVQGNLYLFCRNMGDQEGMQAATQYQEAFESLARELKKAGSSLQRVLYLTVRAPQDVTHGAAFRNAYRDVFGEAGPTVRFLPSKEGSLGFDIIAGPADVYKPSLLRRAA